MLSHAHLKENVFFKNVKLIDYKLEGERLVFLKVVESRKGYTQRL